MAISSKYNPAETEDKWYAEWMKHKLFSSKPNPDKEPFTIVIPPPNVTGVLHMGHMLNNTLQDVLIRRARMQGLEALWVPGTDHASIATEAKVVGMLREKGIKKRDLDRDKFMEYAWEWKEKYGGIILEQLKKLGASCDWDRTAFTMDPDYYKAVIRVFIDMYKKGYIYRGLRMINWDCSAQTALSNEEVIYREGGENAKFYSVKYKVAGTQDEWVTVATVRPETILGDSAIAVNPTDERYQHLIGKKVLVPFINREIPVIADEYVEKDFGTGCLKVTPAHDPNDWEIGQRHNLEVIDTINNDGTLNENCGIDKYVGKDRFEVRELIVKDLQDAGQLVKIEEFITRIGRSERTDSVVEPKLSLQWFIKMKEISKRALEAVENDEITLVPDKFKNTYRHWMENVRDWCISRQLWWGHRIPAYYYGEGEDDFVIAESLEEAITLAKEKTGKNITADDLRQDEDVLDTWASSWLWPIEVFGGLQEGSFDKQTGKVIKGKNAELDYYYPTSVLITAPDILFFWVARMIIAGYEYMDEMPFKDVYLTGMVRDKKGRKMSKSLGNSPDPLDLIKQYGADGVRTGMLFSAPAGNDLLFDEKLCEQGRNFGNKIWNAFRLVKGWEISTESQPKVCQVAVNWFDNKLSSVITTINDQFTQYRISDALMLVYKLIWDDFCSQYLEMIKPAFGSPIDKVTYDATIDFFEKLMKVLHPLMPFITEDIYQNIAPREKGDFIMMAAQPKAGPVDEKILKHADKVFELVGNLRNIRAQKQISPKEQLELFVDAKDEAVYKQFDAVIIKLANLTSLSFTNKAVEDAVHFIVETDECYVPITTKINVDEEIAALEKEIAYQRGFLSTVMKKLSNERFVNSAPPAVVDGEKKKRSDAEQKIKALEEKLFKLKS